MLDCGTNDLHIVVYLQDFNEQIIKDITFENVRNFIEKSKLKQNIDFKFVYGDWRQLLVSKLLPENYFNLILTSETIYNPVNYKHLLNLFQVCLMRNENQDETKDLPKSKKLKNCNCLEAFVLLSAKTYYFGCGGNLLEFVNLAKSDTYHFKSSQNLLIDPIINSNIDDNCDRSENKDEQEEEDLNDNNKANDNSSCKSSIKNPTTTATTSINSSSNSSSIFTSTISKEIIKICFY